MTAEIIHGDCLDVLRGMPDASVDAVITDPPYGTTRSKWDTVIPFAPMWEQLWRVTKCDAAVVLFSAQPFTAALVMSQPDAFLYEWCWDKANPSGHLNARRRPLHRHEQVLVFSRGRAPYFPQMRAGKLRTKGSAKLSSDCYGAQRGHVAVSDQYYPTSILSFSNAHRAGKVHPNQKPVDLMAYLVRTYTRPGGVVLDFCAGSGSTGVACVQTGRRFIGIEREAAYAEIARQRIADAQAQLTLGAA